MKSVREGVFPEEESFGKLYDPIRGGRVGLRLMAYGEAVGASSSA